MYGSCGVKVVEKKKFVMEEAVPVRIKYGEGHSVYPEVLPTLAAGIKEIVSSMSVTVFVCLDFFCLK